MNLRPLALIAMLIATSCSPAPNPDAGDSTVSMDATDTTQPPSDGPDSGVPGVTVEFGTGQNEYVDLPPMGGSVELIFGAQGGYHFWGRAKFHGFAPDVDISFSVTDLVTNQVLHIPQPARRRIEGGVSYGLLDLGDATYVTTEQLVYLNIQCSSEVVGHTLDAWVYVHDRATNQTASAERIVTLVDNDPSPSCVADGSGDGGAVDASDGGP